MATEVDIDIVDLDGEVRRNVFDGPRAAGSNLFQIDGTNDDGSDLGGGVYIVRAVVGADTLRFTTVRDVLPDGEEGPFGRLLGRTDAEGRVVVTDRTTVPAFYGIDSVGYTDDLGFSLGELRLSRSAEIVVFSADGDERASETVRFEDGPNDVEIDL